MRTNVVRCKLKLLFGCRNTQRANLIVSCVSHLFYTLDIVHVPHCISSLYFKNLEFFSGDTINCL